MLAAHGIDASTLRPLAVPAGRSFAFSVGGVAALETWQKLQVMAEDTGMSPVVLGGDGLTDQLLVQGSSHPNWVDPESIVETSLNIPVPGWFLRRQSANPQANDFTAQEWPAEPPAPPQTQLMASIDPQTMNPLAQVWIALLPTPASWEVPAYLQFGGFAKCPEPAEHVAIWRRWQALYGAEVAAVTSDTLEARVTRPPDNRAAALRLAREQCIYCGDILASGVQSIEALAAYLLTSPMWAFWWN